MSSSAISDNPHTGEIATLLRGETVSIATWAKSENLRRVALHVGVIAIGAGLYGAAMGWWRAPLQAGYVALKLPLILLMTTLANALLNAMLAPLLGINLAFRQCVQGILMSYAIAAAILGAFSPLAAFVVWNTPAASAAEGNGPAYGAMMLAHVGAIALAGIVSNLRLYQWLRHVGGKSAALRVLVAWLAGNLLFGSQLGWILRPFIGSPVLPVEFIRQAAFNGNFFEAVFSALKRVILN